MMDLGKAYKVVRRTELGTLVSCSVENPGLVVEYRPGLWVEARVGGLLVFMDHRLAQFFAGSLYAREHETFQVWSCEVSEPLKLPEFCLTRTDFLEAVDLLWRSEDVRAIKHCIRPAKLEFWPFGTAAFRKLKLLERVE
jgi:hypothetical protein